MILDKSKEGIEKLLFNTWQMLCVDEYSTQKFISDYFKITESLEEIPALYSIFGIDSTDEKAIQELKGNFKAQEDSVLTNAIKEKIDLKTIGIDVSAKKMKEVESKISAEAVP